MRKVLIAIDYHPTSEKVAENGYELAQMLNAEICLIHVIGEERYYNMEYPTFLGYEGFDYPVDLQINSEIEKVAEDYLKKAASHLHNTVKTHVGIGETADVILDYAKEWKADVLVLGTHSRSVLEKIFMGTQATRILEKTKIPVYMVPVKK